MLAGAGSRPQYTTGSKLRARMRKLTRSLLLVVLVAVLRASRKEEILTLLEKTSTKWPCHNKRNACRKETSTMRVCAANTECKWKHVSQ